jgi:dihydrofolate synthase/folylpolyglutamate synthase
MTYQETIDFLYKRLPMFSRIGAAAYKKDLTNTLALCKALNNPEKKFRSIHIAGTNGKGSVSHMLAAIFQTAGYKTALYTSPHLKDFRERIRVNGKEIPQEFVVNFTEKVIPLIDEIEPSFFEITVAMAFEWFAEEQVEMAIIETGLGGRLDSTNVITPELSVITNIGWDHANILGDSIDKIAFEKAGIIKKNVPVVIGETDPVTAQVFIKKAEKENATIVFADQHRMVTNWQYKNHLLEVEVDEHHNDEHHEYLLDLAGFYQTKNLITVLESIHVYNQFNAPINIDYIKQALKQVKHLTHLHGRWELVHRSPDIILDVAHNEDGIRQVVTQLELMDFDDLHIVMGMVKDKDITRVLALLPPVARYYFTNATIPRALPAEELKAAAAAFGLEGKTFSDVNSAIKAARQHAKSKSLILVCGSVFLVGEVNTTEFSQY